MKIVNCTPHPIVLLNEKEEMVLSLPKGEVVPRLSTSTKQVDIVNGIAITETQFGEIEGLPAEQVDTIFIVSRLVLSACKDRNDLVVPNELVRDENGNITGCKSLARN